MNRAIGKHLHGNRLKGLQMNFEIMKQKKQLRHAGYFEHLEHPNLQPLYQQFHIHGNECRIIGSSPYDHGSANAILSVLQEYKPEIVILGEKNRSNFEELTRQNDKYTSIPALYDEKDHIYAKNLYTKFFRRQLPSELNYFMNEEDVFYSVDNNLKRINVDDYATAAHVVHKEMNVGLLFGRPDTTLQLEDLALRFSLENLQRMFLTTIETTMEELRDPDQFPFTDNQMIMTKIREVSKKIHKDTLHGKSLGYQASLLKQCSRNYKKSLLITSNKFPQEIDQLCQEPALPEHNEYFRTFLKAENNKDNLGSVHEEWEGDVDQEKIDDILNLSKSRFNFKKERRLYENIPNLNPEEVMEKFVILNQLIDNEMRMFLLEGQNPFAITIFADLFKKYSQDELLMMYTKLNQKYAMELNNIQNMEIHRLATYTGHRGRITRKPYEESIKKIEERKKEFGYQYRTGFIRKAKEMTIASSMLWEQMMKNIKNRQAKGIPQNEILLHLERIKKGQATRESIEVYNELKLEANAQLHLMKMPSTYRKYFRFIKEMNIKSVEESTGKSIKQLADDVVEKTIYNKLRPSELLEDEEGEAVGRLTEKQRARLTASLAQLHEPEGMDERVEFFEGMRQHRLERAGGKTGGMDQLNTMVMGDDKPFPLDLSKLSLEDIRELGAEVISDFDVRIKADGSVDASHLTQKEIDKLAKVGEILEENEKDEDAEVWEEVDEKELESEVKRKHR